jgi:ABC-2 type transport system ATP-binding protein
MHGGRAAATGSPAELKALVGPDATLEDVFTHFAGGEIESGGTYRDIRPTRDTMRRLG